MLADQKRQLETAPTTLASARYVGEDARASIDIVTA
jgi:hypothetical protein